MVEESVAVGKAWMKIREVLVSFIDVRLPYDVVARPASPLDTSAESSSIIRTDLLVPMHNPPSHSPHLLIFPITSL